MTKVANDFNFAKYDIGGKDAVANDGKLTGEEVKRATRAGYCVWDGYTEENGEPKGDGAKGTPFMALTRDSALSNSKFCQTGSTVLDIVLSPITFPIAMIQAFFR